MSYKDRFWKSNWDSNIKDLDPKEFETSFIQATRRTFEEVPEKVAFFFYGNEVSYGELDKLSNEFANMLIENGFRKGDVLAICLVNIPEYVIGVLGGLKAGLIISGVSPLLSAVKIQYELNDLGSGGKQLALLSLDAVFAGHITKIYDKIPSLKLVVATSIGGFMPKMLARLGKMVGKIPKGKITPLEGITVFKYHKNVKEKYSDELPDIKVSPEDIAFPHQFPCYVQ